MITAENLKEVLVAQRKVQDNLVDEWLKNKVMPIFAMNGTVVEKPSNISLSLLGEILGERGIRVTLVKGAAKTADKTGRVLVEIHI